MVYTYDESNKNMANYKLLKAEVQRILKLLQRDRLDFLNLAFMKSALDNDPEYLNKIGFNISNLKKEGLIRLAEIGIKWNLSHEAVTNLIVGTNNADHLVNNLNVLNNLELTGEDNSIIEKIRTSNSYKAYEERKANEFFELK